MYFQFEEDGTPVLIFPETVTGAGQYTPPPWVQFAGPAAGGGAEAPEGGGDAEAPEEGEAPAPEEDGAEGGESEEG